MQAQAQARPSGPERRKKLPVRALPSSYVARQTRNVIRHLSERHDTCDIAADCGRVYQIHRERHAAEGTAYHRVHQILREFA